MPADGSTVDTPEALLAAVNNHFGVEPEPVVVQAQVEPVEVAADLTVESVEIAMADPQLEEEAPVEEPDADPVTRHRHGPSGKGFGGFGRRV